MALFTPVQLEELSRLSADLLDHIRRVLRHEDPPSGRFGELMGTLQVRYGACGAAFAVRAWLDAVIEAAPTFGRGDIHAIVFADAEGTGYQDPREMTPDYRWAGAALLARVSDDQVGLYKLIDQLPTFGAGLYLLRTLQVCADLINVYDSPASDDRPVRAGEIVQIRVVCPR